MAEVFSDDLNLQIGDLLLSHTLSTLKSSQVNTLPKAKIKTRSKQNKDMHKCSSVYSERGVPLPVLTSGGQ